MARCTAPRLLLALVTSFAFVGACETTAPAAPPPPPTEAPAPAPTAPTPAPPAAPILSKIGALEYLEFTTAGAPIDAPLPMLVAIHGLGDNPVNFANLVRDLPIPARVIIPRAIDSYEPGWSWFPLRARDPDVEGLAKGMMVAADLLAESVASLAATRPTQGKPVVTGFSQGGMLSFALAAQHGDLWSASIPVSGWLPPPLWPDKDRATTMPPLVALHGTEDPALKYPKTVACVEALTARGATVSLKTYPGVAHVISPPMRAELHQQLMTSLAQQAAEDPFRAP